MPESSSHVYLIPTTISEGAIETIPSYLIEKVKECEAFFIENERSARRFLKSIWNEMVIDNYQWFPIHKMEKDNLVFFKNFLRDGKTVGILSEAGCPGVADPGQWLIRAAQEAGARVIPLVGPSSILLALMASGMNGQQFSFHGYLPIDETEKSKQLKELEQESTRKNFTQIFIETPYRNQQLFELILKVCRPETRLCLALDITGAEEKIHTRKIREWKNDKPRLHKKPVIFLIYAGRI